MSSKAEEHDIELQSEFHNLRHLLLSQVPFALVEVRGVEPLSENNLTRTSPGAVCYLHSLGGTRTNTLTVSVAS